MRVLLYTQPRSCNTLQMKKKKENWNKINHQTLVYFHVATLLSLALRVRQKNFFSNVKPLIKTTFRVMWFQIMFLMVMTAQAALYSI